MPERRPSGYGPIFRSQDTRPCRDPGSVDRWGTLGSMGARRTGQQTCDRSGYGFRALPMTVYPYGLVGQFEGITLGCHSKWSCGTPPRASPVSPTYPMTSPAATVPFELAE